MALAAGAFSALARVVRLAISRWNRSSQILRSSGVLVCSSATLTRVHRHTSECRELVLRAIFPQAIENGPPPSVAEGNDRYIWTTGSCCYYEYLEKAAAPAAEADGGGHLQPGILPGTRFRSPADGVHGPFADRRGLAFSAVAGQRFGRTTTGRQMTERVRSHAAPSSGALARARCEISRYRRQWGRRTVPKSAVFRWKDPAARRTDDGLHADFLRRPSSRSARDRILPSTWPMHGDNTRSHFIKEIREIFAGCGSDSPMLA